MAERLTPTFLQTLLAQDEPALAVTQVLVNPGSGRGDNYTAMLYRVDVKGFLVSENSEETGCPWERSLIYKCLPASKERRQAYRSDVLFSNEVAFYTRALPALLDFQRSRGVDSGFHAVPRCYTARQDLLLLEDLRTRGFVMLDRKAGLDAPQCRAVLTELAKFHALSLAMRAQQPDEFARDVAGCVREALFVPENEAWYRDYYAAACRSALASVREILPQSYADKFEEFTRGFFTRMTSLVRNPGAQPITACQLNAGDSNEPITDWEEEAGGLREPIANWEELVEDLSKSNSKEEVEGELTDEPITIWKDEAVNLNQPIVLCHGDCWTNNILFRIDETSGDIVEVCLLDFQLVRVGSPALDLANLLYCCTTSELRASHLNNLLAHYHAQVSRSLRELGSPDCREMTLAALRRELRRFAGFGLGLALDMIPISTCESAEAPDLYCGQQGADTTRADCGLLAAPPTEQGKRRMAELVQELVDQGLI